VKALAALLALMMSGAVGAEVVSGPERAVDAFQDALSGNDFGPFSTLISAGSDPETWTDLRDLIGGRDCITIEDLSWALVDAGSGDEEIRIELRGHASTKAPSRPVVSLPKRWRIRLRAEHPGWSVAGVMCEERLLARAMLAAASRAEAAELFVAAKDVDRSEVFHEMVDETIQGPYEARARELLEPTLELAMRYGIPADEVVLLHAVAVGEALRDAKDAFTWAECSWEIAEKRGTPDDRCRAILTMGLVRYLQNDLDASSELFARSAALVDRVRDPVPALKSLRMYGFVEGVRGSIFGMARASESLVVESSRYGWKEGVELGLMIRAQIQHEFGNDRVALGDLERLADLTRASGNRFFQAVTLNKIALIQIADGNLEAAVQLLRRATALSPGNQDEQQLLPLLASAYARRGALPEAEEALKSAERFLSNTAGVDPFHRATILIASSEIARRRGDLSRALSDAHRAAGEVASLPGAELAEAHAIALCRSGQALRALSRNDEAIADLEAAVGIVESERRQLPQDDRARMTFLSGNLEPYAELVDALVTRGEARRALRISELMKARALFDSATAGRIDLSASMSKDERDREVELEERISKANRDLYAKSAAKAPGEIEKELQSARAELERFRTEMLLQHPTLARRRTTSDEKLALPESAEGRALVEYVVGPRRTTILCLAGRGEAAVVRAFTAPIGEAELEAKVRRFVGRIDGRDWGYAGEAKELYRLLLAPIERQIGGSDLVVVPDRQLWLLPFQALVTPRGRHVVDERAVSYAPSLAVLRATSPASKPPSSKLLALANPVRSGTPAVPASFRSIELGRLPEAENEVRRLARFYDRTGSRAFFRDEARESEFKRDAGAYDVIHIAAHAVVDDRTPMYSAIVLADDARPGGDDGLLEAREIVGLSLKARLAILSACDTARGGVKMGEGVIGLSWAFMAAGCPTTVVSQWRAESKATAKLMVEFHRRLAAGDSPARALRKAQQWLRKDPMYAHPI